MTLVELLVASALLIGLLTIVAISLHAFMTVGNQVQASYNNTNSVIPSSTTLQRLIRTMVEPAPPSARAFHPPPRPCSRRPPRPPTPPRSTPTWGAPWARPRSSPASPGQPSPSPSSSRPPGHRHVCPFSNTDTTDQCNYPASGRCSPSSPSPMSRTWSPARRCSPTPFSIPTSPPPRPWAPAHLHHHFTATPVGTLTGTGTRESSTCPGDAVQGVEVNLQIKSPGSVQTTQDTVVYRLSAMSQLYDPNVG